MLGQITKYIRDNAPDWLPEFNREDILTPLFRFNKEADGIVQKEKIGIVIFWFSGVNCKPCLVSKIMSSSLPVEYIKSRALQQQEINRKIGVPVFPIIYEVAKMQNCPVIFQEVVDAPTYEMELQRAIYGPSGHISILRQVVARQFKEMSLLFNCLKNIDVVNERLEWGDKAYRIGQKLRDNYNLKLEFLTDDCLDAMRKEINLLPLQNNYVLVDHYCANYFLGPRVVDQIDQSLDKRISEEPGIIDVFRFIIAYFKTSPLNAICEHWLDALAFSIVDKDGLSIAALPLRGLLLKLGLDVDQPKKIWALVMESFFLRAIDELAFHQQNIFMISALKAQLERSTKRLIEIKDIFEKGKYFDSSTVLNAEKMFIPPAKSPSFSHAGQSPKLLKEGYRGFNVVLHGDKYYALSQELGAVDFTWLEEKRLREYQKHNKCFVGNSLEEAIHFVEQAWVCRTITLVEEGYAGFNIVKADNHFYALAQSLGSIDFSDPHIEDYLQRFSDNLKCFSADSIEQVKAFIDKSQNNILQPDISTKDESIGSLNKTIDLLQNHIEELNKQIASLQADISTKDESIDSLNTTIEFLQNDIAESNKRIASLQLDISAKDETINSLNLETMFIAKPQLIDTLGGYNIIKYAAKYYGVLTVLGPVDFDKKEEISHPSIISAKTQIELEKLIDESDPSPYIPQLVEEYFGYNLVAYGGQIYAIPQVLGKVDLNRAIERNSPLILAAEDKQILKEKIDILNKSISVEYAGWLPPFQQFGNCGNHPQFAHINTPPAGYRFTYSKPNHGKLSVKKRLRRYLAFSLSGISIVFTAFKFTILAWSKGAKLGNILRFFITRGVKSQLLLNSKQNLVFLTSVPYTFGQYPWVIELEDPISFLFPFFHNGETGLADFQKSPYFPVFKTLIESKQCRGIITHIKSTAENLPRLFNSEKVASKITYVPMGIKLPSVFHIITKEKKQINLLFNNSWHQDPRSFFLRGGLDVLSAFGKLRERYKNIYLTIRSSLPSLDSEYLSIIKKNNVRVVKQFLTKSDWEMLMKESDIYLLPSDRIHVVSMLEAMSYGLPVVVSDGWGFEEYIQDRVNGMIVKGRYGKAVWMDNETGMLRENYSLMYYRDPVIVNGLVDAVTSLIEDKDLYEKISRKAREDIETKYNLENWNNGLKQAFDKALNRGVRV